MYRLTHPSKNGDFPYRIVELRELLSVSHFLTGAGNQMLKAHNNASGSPKDCPQTNASQNTISDVFLPIRARLAGTPLLRAKSDGSAQGAPALSIS